MSATLTVESTRGTRWHRFLALSRDADGWWLNAAALDPETPLWGPYDTRGEAAEARRSYLRNAIEKPWLKELRAAQPVKRKVARRVK